MVVSKSVPRVAFLEEDAVAEVLLQVAAVPEWKAEVGLRREGLLERSVASGVLQS